MSGVKKRRAVAFLHGQYRDSDLPFYRELCRGGRTIAVDGGYGFFRKAGMVPDVLIGDFDSLKRMPKLPKATQILRYPQHKDKTDAHLAIDYCLEQGVGKIDLVMPACGDIDHALGSILLLGLAGLVKGPRPEVRVVNPGYEVRLVADGQTVFSACAGDTVSVLPLSSRILLTCSGMEYAARRVWLRLGETRGLRNRVTRPRATVAVKGKALAIHLFDGGRK